MLALKPANTDDNPEVKIPILMYHSLLKDKSRWNDYVISPDKFEDDLIYLKDNGYNTVFLSQVVDYVQNGTPLPENPIVLTFDDGYYNNYSYALDLLKKYNAKAVISPIVSSTQEFSDIIDISPYYGHCSWSDLKEMLDSGHFEIQNHSFDLHSTTGRLGVSQKNKESVEDYFATVKPDIEKAQNYISQNLGVTPQCFTYPFGAYNEESEKMIKELGFVCSLSCTQKISTVKMYDNDSLFLLGRFLRDNNHSAEYLLTHNN